MSEALALPPIPEGFVPVDVNSPALPKGFQVAQPTPDLTKLPPIPEGFTLSGAKPVEKIAVEEPGYIDGAINLAKGLGERVVQLEGSAVRGMSTMLPGSDPVSDFIYSITGTEKPKNYPTQEEVTKVGQEVATQMKNVDLGFNEGDTWEDVKKAPASKFLPWALKTGLLSAPDMAVAVASLPGYAAIRSGELAQGRAENDERQNATVEDMLKAAPAAVASGLLDRIGASKMFGLDEAAVQGVKSLLKETGKATLVEGGTEAAQTVIEDLGTDLGTKKGFDPARTAENALASSLAGGVTGGVVRGVTGTKEALTTPPIPEGFKVVESPQKTSRLPAEGYEGATVETVDAPIDQAPVTRDGSEDGVSPPISSLPSVTAEDRATLRRASMVDEDIDAMSSEEIAQKVQEARDAGIRPTRMMVKQAESYALPVTTPVQPQEAVQSVPAIPAPDSAQTVEATPRLPQGTQIPIPEERPVELTPQVQSELARTVDQSVQEDRAADVERAVSPEVLQSLADATRDSLAADAIAPVLPALAQATEQSLAEDMRGQGTRQSPVVVTSPVHVEAAAQKVNTEPTDAQKEVGNYNKGHLKLHGLDISLETPKAAIRSGTNPDGQKWEVQSPAHYGYIKSVKARSPDKEHVDVYVGDMPGADTAVIINQYEPSTGRFDESKIILGARDINDAVRIYDAGFSDGSGPSRRQGIVTIPVSGLKDYLNTRDFTKPAKRIEAKTRKLNEQGHPVNAKGTVIKPDSITEFLARRGGIREETGELKSLGLADRKAGFVAGVGPLVRAKGMHPDKAREAAVEAGYLNEDASVDDLYEALAQDTRDGRQSFSRQDADWNAAYRDTRGSEESSADEAAVMADRQEVLDRLIAEGFPASAAPKMAASVSSYIEDGKTFEDAVEMAYVDMARTVVEPTPVFDDIPFFEESTSENVTGNAPESGSRDRAPGERGDGQREENRVEGDRGDRSGGGETRSEDARDGSREDGERSNRESTPERQSLTPPAKVYHGTSSGGFDSFDTYGGEYGLFGNGGYFTEDPSIALEYTRKGKGDNPTVYQTSIDVKNALDMDAPADKAKWEAAFGDELDEQDLRVGVTNQDMYRAVEEFLSGEMLPKWEGAEMMQDGIRSMGYDAITHMGGGRHKLSKGTKHRVWIVFDPEQVSKLEKATIAQPEPAVERGADNKPQTVIPGAERASDATMAQRKADAPLKPKVAQKDAGGLFSDEMDQMDLMDFSINPSTQTEAFKRWFSGSKVVDEKGNPLVVYHGAKRSDRINAAGKFDRKRATSGPMAFFTDDPQIASNYAESKEDTSLDDETHLADRFQVKLKGMRNTRSISQSWWSLDSEERQRIADNASRVMVDDDDNIVLGDEGHNTGIGNYDWEIKQARGNHLAALAESWLHSGQLFNEEERFMEVLKLAGVTTPVTYVDPNAAYPGVFPVYLAIRRPLVTDAVPDEVVSALEKSSRRQRAPRYDTGKDLWDKSVRDPREWIGSLKEDLASQKNSHAWTSIPDWVTATLRDLGYDGIKDTGGKLGGQEHAVWVPFEETQVKSFLNRGTFDPDNPKISYSDAPAGWGEVESAPLPRLSESEQAHLASIVAKVAGLDASFVDQIKVPKGAPGLLAWGKNEEGSTAAGFYANVRDAIVLALDTSPVLADKTAYHEAFHRLQNLFLNEGERRVLMAELPRLRQIIAQQGTYSPQTVSAMSRKEVEAEAFGLWSSAMDKDSAGPFRLHIALRRAWGRIREMSRRVKNYLNGKGFKTSEDVFRSAKSGKTAKRTTSALPTMDQVELSANPAVTESPAFKRWFGKSKVVDADGKPLVVYHGSTSDIQSFSRAKTVDGGFHFGTAAQANMRASGEGKNLTPAYLSITNPRRSKDMGGNWKSKIASAKSDGHDGIVYLNRYEGIPYAEFEAAQNKGLNLDRMTDEQFRKAIPSAQDSFIAFEPTQIKSATGNRGTFDPSDDRIDYSIVERAEPERIPEIRIGGRIEGQLSKAIAAKVKKGKLGGKYDARNPDDGELSSDLARRKIVDYLDPVKLMQDRAGVTMNDLINPYQTARLAEGTMRHQIQQIDDKYVAPAVQELAAVGASLEDLHRFMYAMHVPERNRVVGLRNEEGSQLYKAASDPSIVGASGKSVNQAKADIAEMMQDREKFNGIRRAASHIRAMLDQGLKDQMANGLINKAQYDQLSSQYKNYVPLRAEADSEGPGGASMPSKSRGFDVRGDEFKAATGRYSEADNVVVYAVNNAEQSVLRAEKNKVGVAALRFINEADPKGENGIAEVYWSDDPKSLDDITKAPPVYKRVIGSDGKVTSRKVNQFVMKDDVVAAKVGGKTYYIKFADQKVGLALKKMSKAELNVALKVLRSFSNWFSLINTRLNPEFILTNLARDVQTATVLAMGRDFSTKEALGIAKNVPSAFAALYRGARGKDPKTKWDALAKEFAAAGGRISFDQYNTVEETAKKLVGKLNSPNRSSPRKAFDAFVGLISALNESIENATRLAAFNAARQQGRTPAQSAFLARDLTVDFQKSGEWNSALGSAYAFFNAAVQGNYNMARALYRSKKVRVALATFVAAGLAQHFFNLWAAGDDDDGENAYKKLLREKPWIFERNIVIFTGGTSYIKIPLGFGMNAFWHLGMQGGAMATGDKGFLDGTLDSTRVAFDAFNPLGSGSWMSMALPTILDPAWEIASNENFAGKPIHPAGNAFDPSPPPESQTAFKSTAQPFRTLAEVMNSLSGGTDKIPGAVDVYPDTLEYVFDFFVGGIGRLAKNSYETAERAVEGEFEPKKTPFIKTFYGDTDDQAKKTEYYSQREAAQWAAGKYKELDEAGDESLDAFYEKHKAEIEANDAFKSAEKQRRRINKDRRAIEKENPADAKAQLEELDKEELEIMNETRKEFYEIRKNLSKSEAN